MNIRKQNTLLGLLVIFITMLAVTKPVKANVTITVVPSSGPSTSSTAFSSFLSNVMQSLENGGGAVGDPTSDPGAYVPITGTITWADFTSVTSSAGYNLWKGEINPASPFDGMLGNRLYDSAVLLSDGVAKISLSMVSVTMTSSDSNHLMNASGSYASLSYSSTRVGVIFGTNGSPNTIITSGSSSLPVDAIYFLGLSNTVIPTNIGTPAQQVQAIANYWDNQLQPVFVTTTYTVASGTDLFTGSASVQVVPEPPVYALCVMGGVAFLAVARRKR